MTAAVGEVPQRIAVVGLGQMGGGIARNLHAAGLLAGAYDLNQEALLDSGLARAIPFGPVSELVQSCDIILFATLTTQQVGASIRGFEVPSGRIIIDVTTSDPQQSRLLSEELVAKGVHYIDAAMTGGAAGADAGTLTLMVGGRDEVVASCRCVFDAIANKVFHLGPAGSGHAMKLVHNLILHSSFLAACEGLRLAERAGLNVAQAVDVLNAGNARSFVTDTRFPRDILSGTMDARSTISNLEKDLGLAVDFGGRLDARIPYAQLTRSLLAKALDAGEKDTDFSWLYPLYEALAQNLEARE